MPKRGSRRLFWRLNATIIAENKSNSIWLGNAITGLWPIRQKKRRRVEIVSPAEHFLRYGYPLPSCPVRAGTRPVGKRWLASGRARGFRAYLLQQEGVFRWGRIFATRGSEPEAKMKADAKSWLLGLSTQPNNPGLDFSIKSADMYKKRIL